jgi:uncharacterized linocin/CFP29 family protein
MLPEVKTDIVTTNEGGGLQIHGAVASQMIQGTALDANMRRPFIGTNNAHYVNMKNNKGEFVAVPMVSNSVTFKSNAVLRRDEWNQLDMAVLRIQRERLATTDDLTSRGLVYPLTNPMGKTVLEYHDVDDPGEAHLGMDPVVQGVNDQPNYTSNYLPIPILYADFTVSERTLQASRNYGDAIDTTMVEACTRRILERLDDMFFTDTSYTYGNGTIYSYLNHPDINTVTLSENWDASGKTGEEIKNDVIAMKQAMIDANHFGPYVIYIPTSYETVLDDDYKDDYPKTIRQRILEIDNIDGIKVVDRLTDDNVIMVQLSSNVVRLVSGFAPKIIQWQSNGGMVHHFKVMAIQVPQIRSDQAGNSGIVVLT